MASSLPDCNMIPLKAMDSSMFKVTLQSTGDDLVMLITVYYCIILAFSDYRFDRHDIAPSILCSTFTSYLVGFIKNKIYLIAMNFISHQI